MHLGRMAEVVRRRERYSSKCLDSDENLTILRFVVINALFGRLWTKSVFLVKTVFLGQKNTITWYILHIILN